MNLSLAFTIQTFCSFCQPIYLLQYYTPIAKLSITDKFHVSLCLESLSYGIHHDIFPSQSRFSANEASYKPVREQRLSAIHVEEIIYE